MKKINRKSHNFEGRIKFNFCNILSKEFDNEIGFSEYTENLTYYLFNNLTTNLDFLNNVLK